MPRMSSPLTCLMTCLTREIRPTASALVGARRAQSQPGYISAPTTRHTDASSAMRIHCLRALEVQRLAIVYSADETASSVMVMQGGSVFEDTAERVLKVGAPSFVSHFTLCVSH